MELVWRARSWATNVGSSAVVAVLSGQILWAAIGIATDFEAADAFAKKYIWHILGSFYVLSFVLRRPAPRKFRSDRVAED